MLKKNVIDLSDHRIAKSKDLLIQAEYLLKNQMYDGSINRAYYAIYNAIRSLLSLIKIDSKKHSGTLSFFDRYFVKTGIFDKQFSEIAHAAFDSRQDYDYDDFSVPSKDEAFLNLQSAQQLIAEVERIRIQFIKGELRLPEVS